jgi:hypothetical protein
MEYWNAGMMGKPKTRGRRSEIRKEMTNDKIPMSSECPMTKVQNLECIAAA